MVFIDLENFRHSVWSRIDGVDLKFDKIHFFLFEKIINVLNWEKYNPRFIRAYVYTGEMTSNLVNKIKNTKRKCRDDVVDAVSKHHERAKELRILQNKAFSIIKNSNFIQLKTIPLKYDIKEGIHQKGVDVQIATDIVSHAYMDNFDVAILCSGDMDLLESIKIVKHLGKKMVLVSCQKEVSDQIIKESDHFFDIAQLTPKELSSVTEKI